jgi:hypothetical protein
MCGLIDAEVLDIPQDQHSGYFSERESIALPFGSPRVLDKSCKCIVGRSLPQQGYAERTGVEKLLLEIDNCRSMRYHLFVYVHCTYIGVGS